MSKFVLAAFSFLTSHRAISTEPSERVLITLLEFVAFSVLVSFTDLILIGIDYRLFLDVMGLIDHVCLEKL